MAVASPIRVFVRFKDEGVVFAGEDIECTITLKNVQTIKRESLQEQQQKTPTRGSGPFGRLKPIRKPWQAVPTRNIPSTQGPQPVITNKRSPPSVPVAADSEERKATIVPNGEHDVMNPGPGRRQGRSISIRTLDHVPQQQRQPGVKHRRSLSLQDTSTTRSNHRKPLWSGKNSFGASSPSQFSEPTTPLGSTPQSPNRGNSELKDFPIEEHSGRRLEISSPVSLRRNPSFPQTQEYSQPFPRHSGPLRTISLNSIPKTAPIVSPPPSVKAHLKERPEGSDPQNKYLSVTSHDGSPRTSLDFYNQSNRSDETLASELPLLQANSRVLRRPPQISRPSQLAPVSLEEGITETLMMGYVQISGSFILDESLVNQVPFEEVKRKAVVGGQAGGGVVGVATPHSGGGYFGGLSWGNIGSNIGSLGGFLGSGQPSSINEMKGIADSKSIPLLSTPKSILFVDLKLGPGESKSFGYKFRMPRGLPPTHKGRAIKVSYHVIVGTQRASKSNQQNIKQVEIPFRLFSGVNSLGESLGHDLFSPYIILKEQARITPLKSLSRPPSPQRINGDSPTNNSSAVDFQTYVNHLLTQPRKASHFGLLSPTAEVEPSSYQLANSAAPTTKTLIDYAIHQSTIPSSAIYSPTKFNIARSSVPVATFMISRPALKLGDLLICVFDFTSAQVPCYALEATLESSEKIDPSLAIRSSHSVDRVTRRIWARSSESCVWARRVTVRFQVPVGATPGFTTTGVGVEWFVRVEIIIAKTSENGVIGVRTRNGVASTRTSLESNGLHIGEGVSTTPAAIEGGSANTGTSLLELVSTDERGATFAARQRLACESFEVAIPIRVFGATAVGSTEGGTGPHGLAI